MTSEQQIAANHRNPQGRLRPMLRLDKRLARSFRTPGYPQLINETKRLQEDYSAE